MKSEPDINRRAESRWRAVTLVELLVVLAVMAAVAGVALPAYFHARAKSRQASCLSNERQLALACLMYADDSDGYLPAVANYLPAPPTLTCGDGMTCSPSLLDQILRPYAASGTGRFCPDDAFAGQAVQRWDIYHLYSSYDFHFRPFPKLRVEGVETRYWVDESTHEQQRGPWPASSYVLIEDPNNYYMGECGANLRPSPPNGGNHFRGVNVAYLDGHCRWVPPVCQ